MEEKKKANFGKPLSKEWWSNIWYYHKGAILIGLVFLVIITITVVLFPKQDQLDMAFLYLGDHVFGDDQRASIGSELEEFAVDWNGDGAKTITFASVELNPYMDDDWNSEYTSLVTQLLDSSIVDLYLMDKTCLQYYKEREEWEDLTEYAERYQVPSENLEYNESGKLIGIKVQSLPLFERNGESDVEFYLMLAGIRTVPVKGLESGMHEQNIDLFEYILSEAQF